MKSWFPRCLLYGSRAPLSKPALLFLVLAVGAIQPWSPSCPSAAEQDDLPYVKKIEIVGNAAFSEGELKKLMRTQERRLYQIFSKPRYVRDLLRRDLATLEAFYHRAGFYEVQVISLGEEDIQFDEKSFSVRIRIRIVEGKRRYLRHLSFIPDLGETEKKLRNRLTLAPGRPFDPQGPGQDMVRIQVALKEEGYFSAQVRYSTRLVPGLPDAPTDSLDLRFTIERGPPARLGDIRYEGYHIPLTLITRELTIREGEPLRLGQLVDSKQNLLDSGFFRTVDFRLRAPEDSSGAGMQRINATWLLRERKMAMFEAGVGWGTADGFNISGDWRHRNVFNIGQHVALSTVFTLNNRRRRFGLSYDRQTLEYSFLRIVRARTYLNTAITREHDSQPITGPPDMNAVENWAIRLGAARRFGFETVTKLTGQVDFTAQEYDTTTIHLETRSLTLLLERDTRNDVLNPWLGGQHRFSVTRAGGILGGDNSYNRITWNQSLHRRRGGGIFAAHFFTGTVWAFGDSKGDPGAPVPILPPDGVPPDGVPLEARFYCGGLATVRGYGENILGPRIQNDPTTVDPANPTANPLGGRIILLTNLEWRTPLRILGKESFQAVFFLDGGNAWQQFEDIGISKFFPWQAGDKDDLTRMFYSLGVGFRYLTPIAVIRVDFGAPLQPLTGNDRQWHLSLGHIF